MIRDKKTTRYFCGFMTASLPRHAVVTSPHFDLCYRKRVVRWSTQKSFAREVAQTDSGNPRDELNESNASQVAAAMACGASASHFFR